MARSKKTMLILGGVVLGIALVAGLYGFIKFTDGQSFNPPTDSFWDGKASDTPDSLSDFSVTGSVQYMVWSEDDGNLPNVSIVDADGEEIFNECGDNCNVKEGFRQLGSFGIPTNDTQTYTITVTGGGNVYVLTPLGGLGDSLMGILSIGVGICFSLCGLVILIIGLGMKSEDALGAQMVQPGVVQPGMVAQQPVQQLVQQPVQQLAQQPVQQLVQQPVQQPNPTVPTVPTNQPIVNPAVEQSTGSPPPIPAEGLPPGWDMQQ